MLLASTLLEYAYNILASTYYYYFAYILYYELVCILIESSYAYRRVSVL